MEEENLFNVPQLHGIKFHFLQDITVIFFPDLSFKIFSSSFECFLFVSSNPRARGLQQPPIRRSNLLLLVENDKIQLKGPLGTYDLFHGLQYVKCNRLKQTQQYKFVYLSFLPKLQYINKAGKLFPPTCAWNMSRTITFLILRKNKETPHQLQSYIRTVFRSE